MEFDELNKTLPYSYEQWIVVRDDGRIVRENDRRPHPFFFDSKKDAANLAREMTAESKIYPERYERPANYIAKRVTLTVADSAGESSGNP